MRKVLKVLSFIFIIIMAAVTLFPFLYMISSSLMSFGEVTQIPPKLLPKAPQFANYVEAMKAAPFARYFVNTVFVSLINTMGTLITTVLAAFALNFLNFKGKTVLQNFMLALLMVPFEIIIFTNYSTIAKLGLLDTYTALIIPFLASVFYIFYLKEFLKSVPMEFYNAAKVDGASDFEFIRRVMIPMCKQNLFTIGLLNFITGWNSFLWPSLTVTDPNKQQIMQIIRSMSSMYSSEYGTIMAATTIATIPGFILFLIFKRYIIQGVVLSGIK